jgi:hypothetical protein
MDNEQIIDFFADSNEDESECFIEAKLDLIKNLTVYRPISKENVEVASMRLNSETTTKRNSKDVAFEQIDSRKMNRHIIDNSAAPFDSSTPLKNVKSTEESHQFKEYAIEDVKILKINGAMGLSIVGGGSDPCHPFGVAEPGIFISKIAPGGAASRTNLRIGDRILKVNNINITGFTHDKTVDELKHYPNEVVLTVRHDPQPSGLTDINLFKAYPEETLGIRIHGGIKTKSANPLDQTDEGIFVIDVRFVFIIYFNLKHFFLF